MTGLTKLGKYEIRRELGKGAMGVVYEGFDPFIKRTVAIKTIPKSLVDSAETQEVFSRFRREAQVAGQLTHPNIVSIYEYGEDDDMAFIAMEFVLGKELKWYFDNEERFQIRDSIRILLQLLDALDYSHNRSVVHRDIKPANILLTEDAMVKVADFGIAKIESSHLTQVGAVLGTPNYMSPEQFTGLAVDRRSDIYSAGVVAYQLLGGERPFVGSVITIMHKVLSQEAVSLMALNPNVTKALDEAVKKAMAKRPDDRFQSAREFMEALKLASDALPAPDAKTGKPVAASINSDATLIMTDSTTALPMPALAAPEIKQHQADIESWKGIKNSPNPDDFRQYLKEYPDGEFIELAKIRIAALEQAAIKARQEETQRKQEAEAKRKKEEEENTRREKQLAEARAKAEAEAIRRRNAEVDAQLKKKIAEFRGEAVKTAVFEYEKRQQGAEAQARRAKFEAELRAKRERKLAELMAANGSDMDAERIRLEVSAWQLQAEKRKLDRKA